MKKTTYLFGLLFAFQAIGYAQCPATGYTCIPDTNFELALVAMGIDDVVDGRILTASAEARTSFMNLSNNDITDMTGIEAFVNLTALKSSANLFTAIDLTSNIAMVDLDLSDSDISSLNLSGNVNLGSLNLSYSPNLTGLVLINNTFLTTLNTEECNILTSLDITGLTNLVEVNLWDNDLSTLNVSLNTGLTNLVIRQNQITTLDLSNNGALVQLNVRDNDMTSVDLRNGNNANVSSFIGTFNSNLACIFVDDPSGVYLSDVSVWELDGGSTYVADEAECNTLSRASNTISQFSVYPNPAASQVNVASNVANGQIEIFNITGKRLLTKDLSLGENTLDVSSLVSGVYLARISANGKIETKKLIIN